MRTRHPGTPFCCGPAAQRRAAQFEFNFALAHNSEGIRPCVSRYRRKVETHGYESVLEQAETMASKRARSKTGCPSRRPGLRSSGVCCLHVPAKDQPTCDIDLPHHIVLQVLSFLDTRAIVQGRCLSRVFRTDAPTLIDMLQFEEGQKLPSAKGMKIFSKVKEVRLDGDSSLVRAAASRLRGASSLRRLAISRDSKTAQRVPLSNTTTKNLCALPLGEFEMHWVEVQFPPKLRMSAWQTLEKLVIRDAFMSDTSLINLASSIPKGPLPLRHLDLSRNLFGQEAAMEPLAQALWSFPEMETVELTATRVGADGAKLVIRALVDGACRKLKILELSLNFLDNSVLSYLEDGLGRAGHGLQNLEKLGIGGRISVGDSITSFEPIARTLAAGSLPSLDFLHLQGDVGPPQVGPLLRKLKLGACPNLAVVKMERSPRFHPAEDRDSTEEAVNSVLELVNSLCAPHLREVHVLGMDLGKELERAGDERTTYYRAKNESCFHRLALAAGKRGVKVFV